MDRLCVFISIFTLLKISMGAPTNHRDSEGDVFDEGFDADMMDLFESDTSTDSNYDYAFQETDYGDLESYACEQGKDQCKNSGKCSLRISGTLDLRFCSCTSKYVGAECTKRKDQLSGSIRTQPQTKDSFHDCMKNSSKAEDTLNIFSNCINQDNICWLHKGGKDALKCFFWLSDNALQLMGVVEENINDKSRMQIYQEVFQKFVTNISDKNNQQASTYHPPAPVYSVQVSIFEYPQQEQPTDNSYSFLSPTTTNRYPQQSTYNTQNRFGPLRLSIEAPSYHPYAGTESQNSLQIEDRNMFPGQDYEEPGDDFLSHITDPYKPIFADDAALSNNDVYDMHPLDGNQETNFDILSNTILHDEQMSEDAILPKIEE